MSPERPALLATSARHLASRDPVITFPTTGGGSWDVWNRFLSFSGEPVFDIGNICGTCEFWFRKLNASTRPVDIERLQAKLTAGMDGLDNEVIESFGELFESSAYQIALFRVVPESVVPGSPADYFVKEQREAWPEAGDEEPNRPGTNYYRIGGRSGVTVPGMSALVFEFIVPLQSEDSLKSERIEFFKASLDEGVTPTAVAVGILDAKQYYDGEFAHWCLSHFLIDGHHKVAAAAKLGRPITLLSFIAIKHGISAPKEIKALLATYESGPRQVESVSVIGRWWSNFRA